MNLAHLLAMIKLLGDPYHLLVIGGPEATRIDSRVTVLPYQADPARLSAHPTARGRGRRRAQ